MNQITDELLRRRRTLFLAKRRKFLNRTRLGKSGGGPSTQLTKAASQLSPTNVGTVNFTLTFPGPVTGLTSADIQTTGSTVTGPLVPTLTGGPTTYNISIAGATGNGNINCLVPVGAANDALGNPTPASNVASVTLDTTRPGVTINLASGQSSTSSISPITFAVQFTEPVTGFLASDIVITGTAGGTKLASLSGGPINYSVEISGMTTAGTVIANVPANAAQDLAGNLSLAAAAPATVNWTVISATTTALTSGTNPSIFGSSVTFTATITTSGTPTGTVQFFDGASALGSAQTVSAGAATLSTSVLALGSHSITAQYSGDATHSGSTSSALSQVVNPVAAVGLKAPLGMGLFLN